VHLVQRGMQADFSWMKSAQAYADLYVTALERRRGAAVPV
jgi:glycogen synthase